MDDSAKQPGPVTDDRAARPVEAGDPPVPASAGTTSAPASPRWQVRIRPWLWVAGVALVLRWGYTQQIRAVPFFDHPVGDAASYDAWGRAIAEGDWSSREHLDGQAFYQAPAYPYFVGLVYATLGDDPLTVRWVQTGLGVAACLFLGFSGTHFFSRRVGVAGGLLLAIYPPAIFFGGLIQKTVLATFWMTLLLWLLGLQLDRPRGWRFFVAGIVLGLFGLTRENALVLTACVLLWIWLGFRDASFLTRRNWSAQLVAGLLLVFYPVALRNYVVGHTWAVTTVQAGPNFYIGNNPEATGRYRPLVRGHETPVYERDDARRLAEQAAGRALGGLEVSRYWFSQSWQFISAHPVRWLRLLGTKLLLAINRYEITDTEGYNVYCGFAWLVGTLAPLLHFGLLIPLAVVGLAASRANWRRVHLLVLLNAALLATIVLFYVFARYRFPLVPITILFAAAGGLALYDGLRARRWKACAGALAVAIPVAVIANWPVNPERRLDAMAFANLGAVVAQQGRLDEAARYFELALQENPDAPETYYNIGMVYRLQGNTRAAIEYLRQAKQRAPDMSKVDHQLGLALEAEGNLVEALRFQRAAVALNPEDRQARAALHRLEQRLGPRQP
jgi:tetratricopeptide (TPR) repeat protein